MFIGLFLTHSLQLRKNLFFCVMYGLLNEMGIVYVSSRFTKMGLSSNGKSEGFQILIICQMYFSDQKIIILQ